MKRSRVGLMRLLHVLTVLALVIGLMAPTLSVASASSVARSTQQGHAPSVPAALSLSPAAGLDRLQSIARQADGVVQGHLIGVTATGAVDTLPFLLTPIAAQRADVTTAAADPQPTPVATPITTADSAVIGPAGGALRSLDGRITLEVPAGAVKVATRFRYTAAEQGAKQQRSFLAPGVLRLSAENATSGVAVTTFDGYLTLRTSVDARQLASSGWNARNLSFYYYAPGIDSWVAMASETDGTGGVASRTNHFTDFGAGRGPEDKIIPSVQGATVDPFSGAASFSLPIDVAPGRGGAQPTLSLSYSSGTVDDTYNSDQNWQSGYHKQANWVGLGWNLNGLYGLTRDISGTQEYADDDTYYLNLGGSYKLVYANNEWKTDPDGYVKIEQYDGGGECGVLSINQAPNCRWKVTTPDGTQHLFAVGTTYGYIQGGTTRYVVSSWVVSTITDTHGNTINYAYSTVDNTESGVTSHAWVYPKTITYPEPNMAAVGFITSTRSDNITFGAGQYGDWKLDAIVITATQTQVRKYTLNYDYGDAYRVYGGSFPGRLLLTGITQSDDDNSDSLPQYSLSYVRCTGGVNFCADGGDGDWKRDYLQVVDNGWGGRVEYGYAARIWPSYHMDGDATLYSCSSNGSACSLQSTRLRVQTRMWFDGLGGFFQQAFSYGTALGQAAWVDGSGQFHGYEFLGHDWAQAATYAPNGSTQEEKVVKQWFYQYPKPGVYKADPRQGKAYQSATSGASLATPVTTTTDIALTAGAVNVIYTQAVTQSVGAKSSVISYTVDSYGNVTGEYNQGDAAVSGDEKTVLTSYLYNTSAWIVNRAKAQSTFTTTNPDTTNWTNLAANQRFAYDSDAPDSCAAGSVAPTKGDLAQTCTWITGTITASPTFARSRFQYDQWGNQTVITDTLGNVSRTGYDSTNHAFPTVITSAVGLTQTQVVDAASGKPTTVYDANGYATAFEYDGFKRLTKVIEPGDSSSYATLVYGYSSTPSPFIRNGNMEGVGDWALAAGSATVLFQTDRALIGAYSLAITKTDSSDVVVAHASQTTPQAGKTYVVSAKVYRPSTAVTATLRVYDGQSTFVVGTTAATGQWEWVRGVITTTTSPTPTLFTVQVLVNGSAGSSLRVDDVQASAPYAVRTDKRETSGQSGTLYSRSLYNGLGQVAQTQAEFDATYEVFQDFAYAASGWRASESVPYTMTLTQANGTPYKLPQTQPSTQYAYDALGRTTTVTNTDSTTVTMAYQDWKTAVVDENGHEKITENDAYGRTITITDTTNTYSSPSWSPTFYGRTSYAYDILGSLLQVVNSDGTASHNITSTMTYDRGGRKVAMTDADMGAWAYQYDLAGNLITQTNALNQNVVFAYDGNNRVTNKTAGSATTTYGYDEPYGNGYKGQRTSMSDVSGSTQWYYDTRGRVTTEGKTIGGASYYTYFTYDAMNRQVTVQLPSAETITTTYTLQGLPDGLQGTAWATRYITSTTYNALGQPLTMQYGNKAIASYSYDANRFRLQAMQVVTTTAPNLVLSLSYKYDAVGNVTAITDSLGTASTENFTYDELNRLTGVSGAYSASYSYDFAGRFVNGPLGTSYTYDPNHAHAPSGLLLQDQHYFQYDANGNMMSRMLNWTVYGQQYDAEGRLITVTQGANTTVFTYDGDGNRVKQVVNGVTTVFVNRWYEVQLGTPDQATTYYLFGGKRVAMRVDNADPIFLHSDHLGGTAATTSGVVAGGSQTSKEKYYAFGGVRSTVGTVPTPYQFTGQRLDASTNLMYYGARYYDGVVGVFIQADTIVPGAGNSQAYNRYAYTLNNPVRYNDPTGHDVGCPGDDASMCGDSSAQGYLNNGNYGYLDLKHFWAGFYQAAWILRWLNEHPDGGVLRIEQSVRPEYHISFQGTYEVSAGVSAEQSEGVALGIFMDFSTVYEQWQAQPPGGASSFSSEDLPSDYLGFYAAARNASLPDVVHALGYKAYDPKEGGLRTKHGPPDAIRNDQFTPMVRQDSGSYRRVEWPSALQVAAPIDGNGLWGRTSSGASGVGGFVYERLPIEVKRLLPH